jgi:hypothetical protein
MRGVTTRADTDGQHGYLDQRLRTCLGMHGDLQCRKAPLFYVQHEVKFSE